MRRSPQLWSAAGLAALIVLSACRGSGTDDSASSRWTAPGGSVAAAGATAASAGCSATPAVPPGETKVDVTAGGEALYYYRHVPPAHDGTNPVPVVLDLHGWGSSAEVQIKTTGFEAMGDAEGFVTVTPEAPGPERVFDAKLGSASLAYLGQVLDEVEQTLCVDQNRIYVDGYSQGAITTSSVACQFADRVAAAATVAGIAVPEGCAPARPVPVIAFHGTADPFVGYDGYVGEKTLDLKAPDGSGRTLRQLGVSTTTKIGPAVPETAAAWAARNGCGTTPAETTVAPQVTRLSFPCPAGDEVELYRDTGGGHEWPGSDFSKSIGSIIGPTTSAIDASDLIWQFFQAHHKEG